MLVGTEPESHILGHPFYIQGTVSIGQNLLSAIITSDNHEALTAIENIINRLLRSRGVWLDIEQLSNLATSPGCAARRWPFGLFKMKLLAIDLAAGKSIGAAGA